MSIPEAIKAHRPTQFGAVEIRRISDHYYVYLISSKWNAEKKRPQKVTGKSIGKITEEEGFIPNANGLHLMKEKRMTPDAAPVVRTYGAYEMLHQLSPDIDAKLKEFFPHLFREIRSIALLRLVDSAGSAKLIRPMLLDSYMNDLWPDLPASDAAVRKFIDQLGSMQEQQEAFMKSQVMPGTTLLFDGTTIFTRAEDSLSEKGRNPQHSQNPQARLLYVFDRNSHKPVFYRVIQGSIVDKSAFMDTIRASGCTDCIIIADKGFYSKKYVSALSTAGMRYILPLREDAALVELEFCANPNDNKWDGVFSHRKQSVWYRKRKNGSNGNFIYTFRDDARRAEQQGHFAERAEKHCDEDEHRPMDVLQETHMGYFSCCSNLDVPAKEIYLHYKERGDIEQCFDYLKNSVSPAASHAHAGNDFRGWAFLNHISLLYFYGLLNALHNTRLDETYSPADVIKLTKHIYRVDAGDDQGYRVSAIQSETQSVLDVLKVDLLRNI